MKDSNKLATTSSQEDLAQCPFKKLNKRLQWVTKNAISKNLAEQQAIKHKEYVSILKTSFDHNEDYFTTIWSHIAHEDVLQFNSMRADLDMSMRLFDTKIKEYFWAGFWIDNNNVIPAERAFVKIGNLGLEDVTAIVKVMLLEQDWDIDHKLLNIEDEIDIRLKNNVLIDSILHLDDFPHALITNDKQQSSTIISSMLQDNFDTATARFSPELVPEVFREPMTADGMIDDQWVVPQLTFGCPIINLQSGRVLKSFVIEFVRKFLQTR